MSDLQTIAVTPDVKRALAERGHVGETYNTVLKRLLDVKDKQEPQKKIRKKEASQGSSRHNGLPTENTTSSDAS